MVSILSVVNLHKRFLLGGVVVDALNGVSLQADEGAFVGIVGRSGSGKSTFLNLIGGLDKPTGGSIMVGDKDLALMSSEEKAEFRRRKVGFVFQSFNLIPSLTAIENVMLPLVFGGAPRGERKRRAEELLSSIGLAGRLGHRPGELSGGEQQRVAICRALAPDPPIILADEPTGNLDTRTAGDIMAIFREMNAKSGKTIFMVTHDMRTARETCTKVVELCDGRVVETGEGGCGKS
ncbi:MAG: ABC transporter ATP-binding protein [Planctomycetota bacterium]|nr:ABC transporter ATP-binding protein [Planctomycetota bacterium]